MKLIQKMNGDYQPQFNEGLQSVKKIEVEEEFKEFTCKICLETLADNEVIPLSSCEHVFHAECIKQFIQSQVDISKFPIFCPEVKCKQTLSDMDIQDLLDYKDYIKFH